MRAHEPHPRSRPRPLRRRAGRARGLVHGPVLAGAAALRAVQPARRTEVSAAGAGGRSAARIRAAFLELFAKDRANIEAGLYPAPTTCASNAPLSALRNSARFFRDLPNVDAAPSAARRHRGARNGKGEAAIRPIICRTSTTRPAAGSREESAQALRHAGRNAVRRRRRRDAPHRARLAGARPQGHRPAAREAPGSSPAAMAASCARCSTPFRALPATGLDLSPAYCDEARKRLADWPQVEIVNGAVGAGAVRGREFRRGHLHLSLPRIAAARAPRRCARDRARAEAGRRAWCSPI